MALHEFEHTRSQPTMDRAQARNLVLHGDPRGPKVALQIADKAAIPAALSQKVAPVVIEKILDKAAPRPTLPEVAISIPEAIDMSTPESVAAALAHMEAQVKEIPGGLFSKGFVKTTQEATEKIVNTHGEATRGEKQRAVIFNRLVAKVTIWENALASNQAPEYTIRIKNEDGVIKGKETHFVTPHLIFAMKSAIKTMYDKELALSPAKELADAANQEKENPTLVEDTLFHQRLQLSEAKEKDTSPVTEETQTETTQALPYDKFRKEAQKPYEKATGEEQVLFTLGEVDKILHSPSLDEPHPEAGKRIKAMMDVRL